MVFVLKKERIHLSFQSNHVELLKCESSIVFVENVLDITWLNKFFLQSSD